MELKLINNEDNFSAKEKLGEFMSAQGMLTEAGIGILDTFFASDGNFALAVFEGELIRGAVLATGDGFRLYLNKLVVEEAYRQQGLGKQLVEKAQDMALHMGILEVVILCKPFLAKWYEGMGFVHDDSSLIYKKSLVDASADCAA